MQGRAAPLGMARMSVLAINPVKVAVDGGEESGFLVLNGDVLVAVLTRLSHPMHEDDTGRWYLEAGFGRCAMQRARLEDALRWLASCLGLDAGAAIAPALAAFVPPPASR